MTIDQLITHSDPLVGIVFLLLCLCILRVLFGLMSGRWSK